MKKLICTLTILLTSMSAQSKNLNEDISHCSGVMPNSFKELNLYFYYTPPKIGSSMLLVLDQGEEIQASYTIAAITAMSFNKTAYELSFKGGFSLGEVRLAKDVFNNEYEFLIYNGDSEKAIKLTCE